MHKIILASASPRRKKLLQQLNIPFEVHPSTKDESYDPDLSPEEIVQQLALQKANDIASHYDNSLVIGADTVVVFNETILEKPKDRHEAKRMLKELGNHTHYVFTGVALSKTGDSNNITDSVTFFEKTEVMFGNISSDDIDRYVASGSPMDKAGSYGIQDDFGAVFVKGINGDYYNVVGFPLHRFYNIMRTFAPEFLAYAKYD